MARPIGGGGAVTAVGALTGGLLSSSCCVLQLLLNWTPIGACAGFSIFTPYQAHLRLLTVALLARMLLKHGVNRRTVATAIASGLLMASQDALAVYNRSGSMPLDIRSRLRQLASAEAHATSAATVREPGNVCYNIAVSGLKCEACASRLRSKLAALPGVMSAAVNFASGSVTVWAEAGVVAGDALVHAIHELDPTRYTARLTSNGCDTAQPPVVASTGNEQQWQHQPAAAQQQEL